MCFEGTVYDSDKIKCLIRCLGHIANVFLYIYTLCYLHCFGVLNPITFHIFRLCISWVDTTGLQIKTNGKQSLISWVLVKAVPALWISLNKHTKSKSSTTTREAGKYWDTKPPNTYRPHKCTWAAEEQNPYSLYICR